MKYRYNLFASVLLLLASFIATVHELEHIQNKHESLFCQICVLSKNFVSSDEIVAFEDHLTQTNYIVYVIENQHYTIHADRSNYSNAPPLILLS